MSRTVFLFLGNISVQRFPRLLPPKGSQNSPIRAGISGYRLVWRAMHNWVVIRNHVEVGPQISGEIYTRVLRQPRTISKTQLL